ncbi:MAG: efflux RND transporter periplasmic adaptor subunit [Calditrichaceae bacterium]|nr:efflux RND transporter periplasmic adaptor subunit [Calditrichia bacterium]NUQ43642.1 efflux RND transporter periplasmic adaptor subunit [Calditrichaceae bacterium]
MKLTFDRRDVPRMAGVSLVALLLTLLPGCGEEQTAVSAPPDVKVTEAVQKDVPVSREWVGQTLGAVDIEIRARVDGWLQGIHFREGTEVKKGTLLYTIDASELQQRVAEAKARLAEAQTMLARAESDVNRYKPLAAAGAVSQRDLETALAEYNARKEEVEAARAYLRLAEIDLGYARITAPIDGLIGISAARVGDFVGRPPNPVILNTISRVDSIHVRFSITEQEYLELVRQLQAQSPQTAPKQKRELELILADGSRYPYKGMVRFTQRQIDPATGTLQFEASFPNPERLVRPGQFARISAIVAERKGAVVVPSRAISELQGQHLVYIVGEGNKVALRRVILGPKAGPFTVIEQGVTAGEKVIVEGFQRVRPDMVVSPTAITQPDTPGGEGGR